MSGTNRHVAAPTRLMPPRITDPTKTIATVPVIVRSTPHSACNRPANWLAWNRGRQPIMPHTANIRARGLNRGPSPTSIKYMGPPWAMPSSSWRRYMQASVQVKNFVHMPSKPAIHIQKMAPGPPMLMAMATPAILPMPIVPDNADESAWKCGISPGSPGLSYLPRNRLKVWRRRRNGNKRQRKAKYNAVPATRKTSGSPHMTSTACCQK